MKGEVWALSATFSPSSYSQAALSSLLSYKTMSWKKTTALSLSYELGRGRDDGSVVRWSVEDVGTLGGECGEWHGRVWLLVLCISWCLLGRGNTFYRHTQWCAACILELFIFSTSCSFQDFYVIRNFFLDEFWKFEWAFMNAVTVVPVICSWIPVISPVGNHGALQVATLLISVHTLAFACCFYWPLKYQAVSDASECLGFL